MLGKDLNIGDLGPGIAPEELLLLPRAIWDSQEPLTAGGASAWSGIRENSMEGNGTTQGPSW